VTGLLGLEMDKVDVCVVHGKGVTAAGVGLGPGGFLHALLEADEDYVVSGGGFVGRLVGDGAGDVSGCERGKR